MRAEQLATSTVEDDVQRLSEAREQVSLAKSRLPDAERVLAEIRARLQAHAEAGRLAGEHAISVRELAEARARALDRKDVWLGIRESRFDGMAAELAGGLAVGCGCPVCAGGGAAARRRRAAAGDQNYG